MIYHTSGINPISHQRALYATIQGCAPRVAARGAFKIEAASIEAKS